MAPDEHVTREELAESIDAACRAADEAWRLVARLALRCEGCGIRWRDPGERWSAYLSEDEPPDVFLLCPYCTISG